MTDGIDVANYQVGDYATAGLGFVFVKATEGTTYTNPKHAAQVATGRAHGLVVGHYHFVRPGSMTAQADYFLKQAAAKAGDILAFDWEDTGVSGAQKDAWLRYVQAKAPHNRVVLYCNRDFWLNRDSTSFCADGLWIADPSAPKGHPRVEHPWLFHQYSSAGGLDRNTCPLTADQLRAWAAGTTPEDDMPLTPADIKAVAAEVIKELTPLLALQPWTYRNKTADKASQAAGHRIPDAYGYLVQTATGVQANTAAVQTLAGLAGKNVDTDTVVAALREAIADAVVHVDVDVTGATDTPAAN